MTPLAVCRFAHFLAAMLVFGSSAYLWLYAPQDLRRALSPRIRGLAVAASPIAFATACVWLSLEAASMADDLGAATNLETISAVLTDTAFGRAWIVHIILAAALVVVVFAWSERWTAIAILSGLMLASLGLVGHAAMQTGVEGVVRTAPTRPCIFCARAPGSAGSFRSSSLSTRAPMATRSVAKP